MSGPMLGMLGKAVGVMLATQVGSGLGALAGEVLSVSDIGLPLAPAGRAALMPANVAAFAEGLDVTEDDVLLYLALREAAHQRLFAHVPWLREHLLGAVTDYARGIEINVEGIQSGIEEQMRGVDPTNPESMQSLLEGGMFDLPQSPAQKAALQRLEITLALVEGWVDEVVRQATEERMPSAAQAAARPSVAGAPPVAPPSRPSPPWSGSSCARAGCATPPPCGARCAPARAPRPATASGCTPTCCPPTPTSTTRSASGRTPRRPTALSDDDFDAELRDLLEAPPDELAGRAAQRRVSLHDDALTTLTAWSAPTPRQEPLRAAVRRPSRSSGPTA